MNAIPSLFDSSSVGFGQRSELSLHRITRLLFKHGMLIAFCFVAVTAAVAYGLKRLPPTYISTAKVLVKLQESRTPSFYSGVAAVRDPDTQESANRGMETEMEIAETWPISAEVVTALGLKYDQVYHPPYMHLLRPLSDFYENYIAPLLGFSPDPERRGFADTVGAFRNSLDVKPIASKSSDTNSNILVLELRGVDRELTRRALDEVVSVFLRYDKRTNLEAGRQAQQVIAHRAEVAANEVSEAQFRLEAFLAGQETAANNSADPYADGGRGGTLAGSQLHGRARSEMLDDGLKTQDATAPGPAHSASKPSNTDGKTRYWFAVDRLKSRLQQSQIELLNLRKGNPAPTAQSRALESEIASLTSQLDNVLRQNARQEATVKSLERNLHLKERELVELRKRLGQITLFLDMDESEANNRVVVEPPLRARSSEWKIRFIVGVAGAVGGLFLGLALAGVREMFDTRIETASDARASLGLPVLGIFPRVPPSIVRTEFKTSPVAEVCGDEQCATQLADSESSALPSSA